MANEEEDYQESRKVQYPLDPSCYKILDEIGRGMSAIVYKAICLPINSSVVAIKAIDLDRWKADFDNLRREAKIMTLLSHPNILKAHCSFTVDRCLWVVMPFMSAGSLHSIIASSFPNGLSEPCIAFVLKETLSALSYLHDQGHLHRDIKSGNILIDSNGSVKLADFGVSASIYESSSYSGSLVMPSSSSFLFTDVTGTPYWMAPEVIHSHTGYSFKADIWSFGITALELAHGRPPLSHLPPSKSLIMKFTKRFRFSDYEKTKGNKNKKFSKSFKDMVGLCLDQDPSKRPTAEKLLKHSFFKNCKGFDFLFKNVLQGLPTVEQRFRVTKLQRLASLNKTSEDDEDEDEVMHAKQRRISGWNFNVVGFELDPVFPTEKDDDSIVKQVRFGGEILMQNKEGESPGSNPSALDSSARVGVEGNEGDKDGGCEAESVCHDHEAESGYKDGGDAHDGAETAAPEEVIGCAVSCEAEIGSGSDVGAFVSETHRGGADAGAIGAGSDMGDEDASAAVCEAGIGGGDNVCPSAVLDKDAMVGSLIFLKKSLDDQRQKVTNMIAFLSGNENVEMSREEQLIQVIEKLKTDLEIEKKKNFELEMELEFLKMQYNSGSD